MTFNNIPPIESGKQLLDLAFSKARVRGVSKDLGGNWLQIIRTKEMLKLDIVKDTLVSKLDALLHAFPASKDLSHFYLELMHLTLDFTSYKKSLGGLNWGMERIRFFHREYVRKIVKTVDRGSITATSKEFYGRISSVIRQVNESLIYLQECRRIMRTYPAVKEMFTVCLYGFPNVGKTTLLNQLTGTKAQVAAYAFTTVSINTGYMKVDGQVIQILDVPGTLARADKMNLIELQAELVVKELADLIIFVLDVSEQGGYSVAQQEKLLQRIGARKPLLVYVSKSDVADGVVLSLWKNKSCTLEQIKTKIAEFAQSDSKL